MWTQVFHTLITLAGAPAQRPKKLHSFSTVTAESQTNIPDPFFLRSASAPTLHGGKRNGKKKKRTMADPNRPDQGKKEGEEREREKNTTPIIIIRKSMMNGKRFLLDRK